MGRNATNKLLQKAKKSKSDEFYTQLTDIESELQHYKNHFENKVVYCNCDDPTTSNFFKYFAINFKELGLKKLIASCYKEQEIDSFNTEKTENGFYYEYTDTKKCEIKPSSTDIIHFKGDGDFRSSESIELLKQADIVVTNPPFSLFREYVAQLIKYDKKFLIIGNINAITYKEIFKLIKNNQAWLGINLGRGVSGFIVPEHYELYGTEARIDELGNRIVSPNNCLWLTNLDTSKRHEDIELTKKYYGNEIDYPKSKLSSKSNMITKDCKECEGESDWEKDMIYAIGTVNKENIIKYLFFIYGRLYAASEDKYERIKEKMKNGIEEIQGVDFKETNELGKVKKVDPLGITDLRIRGMWSIEHPFKVFDYLKEIDKKDNINGYTIYGIIPKEKYDGFDKKEIVELEENVNVTIFKDKKVKNPNNPSILLDVVLVKITLKNGGNV